MKSVSARDWLGIIALLGMFAYAFKFGMNETVASMLSGLFGVLLGSSMRERNGEGGG